jgi:hypothetical protein
MEKVTAVISGGFFQKNDANHITFLSGAHHEFFRDHEFLERPVLQFDPDQIRSRQLA